MAKRQHWWHCTSENLGESFQAVRRPPLHMSNKEPPVPRLCVAPTVAECFAAVLFAECQPVYCYRTAQPRRAVMPRDVWDQVITRERWLIPPVTMILMRTVPGSEVHRAQAAIRMYHTYTRTNSSLSVRVAQFAIASEVLGSESIQARSRRCCDIVGIDDPEDFLLATIDEKLSRQQIS